MPKNRASPAEYLIVRRALGYRLDGANRLLRSLLDYLEATGADQITVECDLERRTLPARSGQRHVFATRAAIRNTPSSPASRSRLVTDANSPAASDTSFESSRPSSGTEERPAVLGRPVNQRVARRRLVVAAGGRARAAESHHRDQAAPATKPRSPPRTPRIAECTTVTASIVTTAS